MPSIRKLLVAAVCTYTSTISLVENQELTQIFIKYMHDIVLKISFLDINSQNWPLEALTKKCENTKHISKIPLHG